MECTPEIEEGVNRSENKEGEREIEDGCGPSMAKGCGQATH